MDSVELIEHLYQQPMCRIALQRIDEAEDAAQMTLYIGDPTKLRFRCYRRANAARKQLAAAIKFYLELL